jgi:hypothetical protein
MPADPAAALRQLIFGYRISQAIAVAASLGVADALARGPRTAGDLAAELECHPETLYRLLRLLAAAGVLHEDGQQRFALTDLGQPLRTDVPGSAREQAILQGRAEVHAAYANLEHAVRTGENPFAAHFGEDIWSWRSTRPDEASQFNRTMAAVTAAIGPAVATAFDFDGVQAVADIGGGSGALIAALLTRHAHLRGIVFDQPAVVSEAVPVLEAAGVADRVELVGGDFFVDVPPADVYLMKAILHDWSDEDSIRILRTIGARAGASGRVLVIERVIGGPNEDLAGKLSDIHMLVMPGGRERTAEEWSSLFDAAGFRLASVNPLTGGWSVIEANANIG